MEKINYNNITFYRLKDFETYYVSKCGKILNTNYKNTKKKGIMKLYKDYKGYLVIYIKKFHKVHRLVAKTFIPNPLNNLVSIILME